MSLPWLVIRTPYYYYYHFFSALKYCNGTNKDSERITVECILEFCVLLLFFFHFRSLAPNQKTTRELVSNLCSNKFSISLYDMPYDNQRNRKNYATVCIFYLKINTIEMFDILHLSVQLCSILYPKVEKKKKKKRSIPGIFS